MTRRANKVYFKRLAGTPAPLQLTLRRRVRFSEVDPLAIVWFGRFALYFEEGNAELGRRCGLSYGDFLQAGLRAPIAQFHVDYLQPLYLDEEFSIVSTLVWSEGARLNMEYELRKLNGSLAARAYTVQLFLSAADNQVCLVAPPLLAVCHARWAAGDFKDLQT